MALKFKANVVVAKTTIIAVAFYNAAMSLGLTMDHLVTSGNDGVHMPTSKHYSNEALDFRTHQLTSPEKSSLVLAIKARLGRDYDCVLEDLNGPNEHLHIEFDAK